MTQTSPRAETTDVSRLLFFNERGVRAIATFFILANVAFVVAVSHMSRSVAPVILGLIIVAGATVLLLRRHPDPFPMRQTLVVIAAVVVSSALVTWQLPTEGPLGRASWHFGANTWLLFFLTLRRRPGLAWVGFAAMGAVSFAWVSWVGRSVMDGVSMLQTHAAILLVATLFASNLRRTSARINALNARSVDAAAAYAAQDAATRIRQQRVSELAEAVVPLLTKIASGAALTAEDKKEFRSSEAALRDGVRGRHLLTPPLQESILQARQRGVDVSVLDDRGRPLTDGAAMATITREVCAVLDQATSGRVTVRLLPAGRDVAVSLVAGDEDADVRMEWDDAGNAVSA